MNNAINKIKKRGDVLAEYMIRRLEAAEHDYANMNMCNLRLHHKLDDYDNAFDKAMLETNVRKDDNKDIIIYDKGSSIRIQPDSPLYLIATILLKKRQEYLDFTKYYNVCPKEMETKKENENEHKD